MRESLALGGRNHNEGREGTDPAYIWRKNIPDRGKGTHKGAAAEWQGSLRDGNIVNE